MNDPHILERADLREAQQLFAVACGASKLHSTLAAYGLARFGDHGALISGCVRDHFPAGLKDELRSLARLVSRYSDLGHDARPKGVRAATMRHLARSVATRDSSGFYGPQPYRKG